MAEPTAAPKRRLPFKPTALRHKSEPKPEAEKKEEEDDGLDLFKRSKSFFPKTLADREARRKRKLSGQNEAASSENTGVDASFDSFKVESQASTSSTSQSRRTSSRDHRTPQPDDDEVYIDESISTPPSKRSKASITSPDDLSNTYHKREPKMSETPSKGALRTIPFHTPSRSTTVASSGHPVVVLDDSDDEPPKKEEEDLYNATPIRKLRDSPEAKPFVIDDDDDDVKEINDPFADEGNEGDTEADEFAEYVLAARRRQEEAEKAKREASNTHIKVFVTTEIPNAVEKMFKFTLHKPLRVVRLAWCEAQVNGTFTPEQVEDIFLTFRERTVYDTTTLSTLGIQPSVSGRLRVSGTHAGNDSDGFIDHMTIVELQAWTREIWDEAQRKKERARLRELGELEDFSSSDLDEDGGVEVVEVPDDEKIKVILKTRKGETVKSSARPQTTAGDLITYFRKVRGLPDSAQVLLYFDGEELEESTTLQDAEIEDMDSIEVHVKE